MNINYRCLRELENNDLFESPEHRSRFSELLNCYCNYPFFNRGLCKCMYLSSWDMEHFTVLLDILNDMTIDRTQNLQLMEDNGKVLADTSEGYDRYIFQLAGAFLSGSHYELPDTHLSPEGAHIIQQALTAAKIIDDVFSHD